MKNAKRQSQRQTCSQLAEGTNTSRAMSGALVSGVTIIHQQTETPRYPFGGRCLHDDGGQDGHEDDGGEHVGMWRMCGCLLYTSPSPRDGLLSRMPSSAWKKK